MNKINNIFNYINICDYPTDSPISSYNNIMLDNSIVVSELNSYENSYLLYYKTDEQTYLLSYIITEGNGLYNYNKYHSLFFNIDDNSIQEAYNKIFVNTNFINISNDNSYNYGISYIDNSYLTQKTNSVTLNNDTISYFYSIKNKINELYEKYKDIYEQISYYNNISLTYNSIKNSTTIYEYKDVDIKYIDNYYFGNGVLDPKYKNDYITLPPNTNTIYCKNINLINISLSIKSDFWGKNNHYNYNNLILNNPNDINYDKPTDTEIFGILIKPQHKNSYFTILNSNFSRYSSPKKFIGKINGIDYYALSINSTYNSIYLENNTDSDFELFKKYGSELTIKINPDNLIYTNKKYISYNVDYDVITSVLNGVKIEDNNYILSQINTKYKTITKFIPTRDHIHINFDNRNIEHGISFKDKNSNLDGSYLCLMDKDYKSFNLIDNYDTFDINNEEMINKLLEENVIWYNYDNVIHYGYNYQYINDNNYKDNLYSYSYSYYIKNYSPIFQNLSTKIINSDLFKKFNSINISNIQSNNLDNILYYDMSSFIYSGKYNSNDIYLYRVFLNKSNKQLQYIDKITI